MVMKKEEVSKILSTIRRKYLLKQEVLARALGLDSPNFQFGGRVSDNRSKNNNHLHGRDTFAYGTLLAQ
jgi:hypothetical protein